MSHPAVRIIANWLQDATYGVNAIAAVVPRDGSDPAPPAVQVYNETQHGWVARNEVPKPLGTVQFPAVLVFLQNGQFDDGVPDAQSSGARTIDGSVQVAVQLVLSNIDTEKAVTAAMYLLMAIRNSLLQLNDPSREAARTLMNAVRIEPTSRVMQGQADAPVGDNVVSAGVLAVTYTTTELTALTLP